MVEVYRLLTGEMPQSPGIEFVYRADETPAVEWSSPIERRPDELLYVLPGFSGEPDIVIKGDHHGEQEEVKDITQGAAPKALLGGKGKGK
jgi:hypothetical protein